MISRRVLLAIPGLGLLFGQEKKIAPAFEMTTYVIGLARKGPAFGTGTKEENDRMMQAHMAHILRMHAEGKLITAGPITDNGDLRGIFVFRGSSPDEVRPLIDDDPTVKSGHLQVDLHPWYAAAGLRVNDPKPAC